jgi:hypothetical protein
LEFVLSSKQFQYDQFKKDERVSVCSMISMKDIKEVSFRRPGREVTYVSSSADDRI